MLLIDNTKRAPVVCVCVCVCVCVEPGTVRIIQSPPGFISLGSRLLLSCSYTAHQSAPVKISWLRASQRIDGNRFMIDSVRQQDDGRYTCVIDTGTRVLSADTVVRVQCTLVLYLVI